VNESADDDFVGLQGVLEPFLCPKKLLYGRFMRSLFLATSVHEAALDSFTPSQSNHRLETEAHHSIKLIRLTGRLAPGFKLIADSRRDNGEAIR
jgi:hypothetical protein